MGKRKKEKEEMEPKISPEQRILSQEEVRMLIDSVKDMRDKLCLSLLYETGCALGELVNIRISEINEREIKISNPDTKETRIVKISFTLAKKISLYVQGNALERESYLFSTKKSNRISVKRAREIIQKYSEKIGYGKLNPQMFRYYHVAHAYLNGVFIENISAQLGIKRYRVFQIIEELNAVSSSNKYDNFLDKLEDVQNE